MSFSVGNFFSRQNLNLVIGLITLLVFLWVIMFAIPGLFINLFDTILGNLILFGLIVLALLYNINLGIGFAVVFVILYRFSHMAKIQTFII
jgi:hypothetical protein